MKQTRRELSAAEWELMHTIWRAGQPVTVRQVLDQAYPQGEKAYTTVQTLMNIMVHKGFLTRRKEGRVNVYAAITGQEDVLRGSLAGIAQRMFQGSFGAMASFLINTGQLNEGEIEQLRSILEKKEGEES